MRTTALTIAAAIALAALAAFGASTAAAAPPVPVGISGHGTDEFLPPKLSLLLSGVVSAAA